jgi:hypothetical protein
LIHAIFRPGRAISKVTPSPSFQSLSINIKVFRPQKYFMIFLPIHHKDVYYRLVSLFM